LTEPADAALRIAAEAVSVELFTRIDRRDLDGALDLYDADAVFLEARGRDEIRQTMTAGLAENAHVRSRHVLGNVRSSVVGADEVLVEYTAVAYTLADGASPVARSVLDQEQLVRRGPDGGLRIAEHRIFGYRVDA
jgi:ketosteroid isomerase-like protein